MNSEHRGVGCIGLGLLGSAIAARLAASGFDVTGFDIDKDKVSAAQAHGVTPAPSIAALCACSEVVLICVTATNNVVDIITGANGIISAPGNVRVVVDHSTTIAATARELAQTLREACGIGLIEVGRLLDRDVSKQDVQRSVGHLVERDLLRWDGLVEEDRRLSAVLLEDAR